MKSIADKLIVIYSADDLHQQVDSEPFAHRR